MDPVCEKKKAIAAGLTVLHNCVRMEKPEWIDWVVKMTELDARTCDLLGLIL